MSNLVNVVIPPLLQSFTYAVPAELEKTIDIGHRVIVPFGHRKTNGFVISKVDAKDAPGQSGKFAIKDIEQGPENQKCFNPADLEFFRWISEYYCDSLSSVIDVAIPPAAPQKFNKYVVLSKNTETPVLKGKVQQQLFDYLHRQGAPVSYTDILRDIKGAAPAVKKLVETGVAEIISEEVIDRHLTTQSAPEWTKSEVHLTETQEKAVRYIVSPPESGGARTILLHGVTGSGKTEVYIEAIKKVTAQGKGALVLVPEIALTPQLIDRFRARLGNQLATLHSGLNRRSRWDSWRALMEKRNFVAIGARSAIFAPVHNLGLIIVDEEHDSSYKQSEGLRYNARDLAIMRSRFANCPVVLGTATPSLESFYQAVQKKYHYIPLPARHSSGSELHMEMVDLNKVKPWEMPSRNVSPVLLDALRQTVNRGEQAFILYNRRGFASYLQCEKCEAVLECPNCSVTFTYHQHRHSLLCHYCNLSHVPPQFCTKCSSTASSSSPESKPGALLMRGAGTEKVFDELRELLPEASIDRLDRDAATDLDKYRLILDNVRSGKTGILVGTQMIAKGHDLPNVTLVGIVDCDVGLHMPDFRAAERIFQLLTQASGRAGRGEKEGRVILQTRVPKHPSLVMTTLKDFKGFARSELGTRERTQYPPFSRLVRIVASSAEKELPGELLIQFRKLIEKFTTQHNLQITVLGPALAPLEKLKTHWRWHMLLKAKSPVALNKAVKMLQSVKVNPKKLRVIFDIDPQEML